MENYNYLGKGLYTVSEASRYTGIDARKIRRWSLGYQSTKSGQPPLYQVELGVMEDKLTLSFLDLIELRFIEAFHKHGVSWKTIRTAAQRAAQIVQFDHPFSTRKFYTDRKAILTRIADAEKEAELLNLVTTQYELDEILTPYLLEGIEFSDQEVPKRWFPQGKTVPIVIDPQINFGRPTIKGTRLETAVLNQMFQSKKTIDEIAKWYEVDSSLVRLAVEFEAGKKIA